MLYTVFRLEIRVSFKTSDVLVHSGLIWFHHFSACFGFTVSCSRLTANLYDIFMLGKETVFQYLQIQGFGVVPVSRFGAMEFPSVLPLRELLEMAEELLQPWDHQPRGANVTGGRCEHQKPFDFQYEIRRDSWKMFPEKSIDVGMLMVLLERELLVGTSW